MMKGTHKRTSAPLLHFGIICACANPQYGKYPSVSPINIGNFFTSEKWKHPSCNW